MKILVVDDDKLNLLFAKNYIKSTLGECEIILCDTPGDVMGILETQNIDIVLLDIIMPNISGIDILSAIREKKEYNDIQVIMLTSMGIHECFTKCFEIGVDDYVLKPIDPTIFGARLKAAVKTRKSALLLREMFEKIKEQNRNLTEMNKKLQETQFHMIQKEKLASIGELAAGVAHEINNPIGYIGSNLETMHSFVDKIINMVTCYREFVNEVKPYSDSIDILKSRIADLENTEQKCKLDFILNDLKDIIVDSVSGVERVTKIVHSLRNFSRAELEDELSKNNLQKIIDEALLIVKNEAKYSIDIEEIKNEIPDVLCSKGHIGQVILNLLMNSIQAIKEQNREDRGRITISTYQDGRYVCCDIKDDGPGIPKDVIGKIFDPFFTTKDVGKGTGLGLSISYDIIVEKHKGELLVQSEPGKGALFTIKLPIER